MMKAKNLYYNKLSETEMETTDLTTNSHSGYKRRELGNKYKEETILAIVLLGIKQLKIGKIIMNLFA